MAAAKHTSAHVCRHCENEFHGRKRKYCTPDCQQQAAYQRKVKRGIKGATGRSRRVPRPIINGRRVCLDCNRGLPMASFPECRTAKSGRRGVCRGCWRVYSRVKRQAEKAISLSVDREMRAALNRRGGSSKIERLCGYSVAELRFHLERQFTRGMSWENFDQIHIDHIIPRASFNLSDERDWRACWALTNLQPRWARDNQSKAARRLSLL